jgi:hypothetical protein
MSIKKYFLQLQITGWNVLLKLIVLWFAHTEIIYDFYLIILVILYIEITKECNV